MTKLAAAIDRHNEILDTLRAKFSYINDDYERQLKKLLAQLTPDERKAVIPHLHPALNPAPTPHARA